MASLPHGWGHDRPGTRLGEAHANPGVSFNDVADERRMDAIWNAALNGTPADIVSFPPRKLLSTAQRIRALIRVA